MELVCETCKMPLNIHGSGCDMGYAKKNPAIHKLESSKHGQLLTCENNKEWIQLKKVPTFCPMCGDKL